MGCLNNEGKFKHWFGNVHLSGPCNRACYFCIGQHMMALDGFNSLKSWPMVGWEPFIERCKARNVATVNLTGTNTDPLLFEKPAQFVGAVKEAGFQVGIRTNAVAHLDRLRYFDTGSVSVVSFDKAIYAAMMGKGEPPDFWRVMAATTHFTPNLKVNIVLGPENTAKGDVFSTLDELASFGVRRVNLREPYGQPHVGNPMAKYPLGPSELKHLGMPIHRYGPIEVTYWDVHYVEVESVNLYASGRVSENYPITLGYDDGGEVHPQSHWEKAERHNEQWVTA